jgi:predicted RNase H-like nuclease (RuvC/YqgF family)
MITYLISAAVFALLIYRLWFLEKATDELQEEVNKKNRTIWDLENEILTIRSTIQQGKDDLNQAKMISEKRIAELEDKLQTFKNQFTQLKNDKSKGGQSDN